MTADVSFNELIQLLLEDCAPRTCISALTEKEREMLLLTLVPYSACATK
jgi:hypothetical protein